MFFYFCNSCLVIINVGKKPIIAKVYFGKDIILFCNLPGHVIQVAECYAMWSYYIKINQAIIQELFFCKQGYSMLSQYFLIPANDIGIVPFPGSCLQ